MNILYRYHYSNLYIACVPLTYWVLNKISNYSLTTWDPTECEFVQVRDISNYTSGQIW